MKLKSSFKNLTKGEVVLWAISLVVVTLSFLLVPTKDYLTLCASLMGVTALIFVAKGLVLGQLLTVIFAVFYGVISFFFGYYGEMITYLCMTTPIAIASVITWIKNPYKDTEEVKVAHMGKTSVMFMSALTLVVTLAFYFILKFLGTTNLFFSTLSVATSFLASYLTMKRSPYYAVAYGANDIVLIILWIMASLENISYVPMILCFVMFLVNDIYGFVNWRKMRKRQEAK